MVNMLTFFLRQVIVKNITCIYNISNHVHLGYKKPLGQICITEIVEIVKFHSMKIIIPELTQFIEGLQTLKIADFVRTYPNIMKQLFVPIVDSPLTAGTFQSLCSLNVFIACFAR